jgi:hypothetical protein
MRDRNDPADALRDYGLRCKHGGTDKETGDRQFLYAQTKLADGAVRELPTLWIKYYRNGGAVLESITGTTKEMVARGNAI